MQVILIILGIILIGYSYIGIKKENRPKDNMTFSNVLKDSKEDLSDYKMELGILRKDIAESLTELQEEILEIKTKLNMPTENLNIFENKENREIISDYKNNIKPEEDKGKKYISENEFLINSGRNDDVISDIDFSNSLENIEIGKVEEIKSLLDQGITEEEICHTLSVSKGEILLVKDLFKK